MHYNQHDLFLRKQQPAIDHFLKCLVTTMKERHGVKMRRWLMYIWVYVCVWWFSALTITVGIQTASQQRSRHWHRDSRESWAPLCLYGAVNVFSFKTGSDAHSSASLEQISNTHNNPPIKNTETDAKNTHTKDFIKLFHLQFNRKDVIQLLLR